MAVAVIQPRQKQEKDEKKKDFLDVIMQGLQIANTVYGIKSGLDTQNRLAKETELREQGLAQDKEQAEFQKSLNIAKLKEAGLEGQYAEKQPKTPGFVGPGERVLTGFEFSPEAKRLKEAQIAKAEREAIGAPGDSLAKQLDLKYKIGQIAKQEREVKEQETALDTPYGRTRTAADANIIKQAAVEKQNFDNKLQQMIDLRKQYGAEVFNREAVARGKQLSKDLLLSYKNMAKLGVLSKADEDIINAIIPEDPLAFQSSSLMGQDPIMARLESFKKDSEKEFSNRLGQYLTPDSFARYQQEGGAVAGPARRGVPQQVQAANKPGISANDHPEKDAALEWARANKNDPRAKAIMERFGVK